MTIHTIFWYDQIIYKNKNKTKSVVSWSFFFSLMIWSSQNIVFTVMICHDPSWLCPQRNRLKIITFRKVNEEIEWDFHFWVRSSDVTAALYTPFIKACCISIGLYRKKTWCHTTESNDWKHVTRAGQRAGSPLQIILGGHTHCLNSLGNF